MTSLRQKKVARLVQRDLGEIFRQQGASIIPGAMISVTIVRISPDLGTAKVYLSIFANGDKKELLAKVSESTSKIRFALGKKVKNQMKKVPGLLFYLDDSLDYYDNINKLLKD